MHSLLCAMKIPNQIIRKTSTLDLEKGKKPQDLIEKIL